MSGWTNHLLVDDDQDEESRPALTKPEPTQREDRFPGNRPEARLLLLCLKPVRRRADAGELARLLGGSLDWSLLLRLASQHALPALLYSRLKDCPAGLVEPKILDQLRGHHECNRQRHFALTQRLMELLQLLGQNGIPVITFKGPLLARALYPDPALRWISDLDLLVHPDDVLKTKSLLLAAGYQTRNLYTPLQEREYLRLNCAYHFVDTSCGLNLDIHWRFSASHLSDPLGTEVWYRAQPFEMGGTQSLRLAPEDQFIFLCKHGARHTWDSLRFLADLGRIVTLDLGGDWAEIARRAKRLGLRDCVDETLFLLKSWLGVPTPPPLRLSLAENRLMAERAALILGRVFRERWGLPGFAEWRSYRMHDPFGSRLQEDGDLSPWPASAPQYLKLVLRKIIEDRNYLMPPLPPFLTSLRPIIWRIRHLCFSTIESLCGR